MLLKLKSSIHAFDKVVDRPEILNLEWVQNSIESGRDILNRSSNIKEHQLMRYLDTYNLPILKKRVAICITLTGRQLLVEKIKTGLILPNTNYSFFLFYNSINSLSYNSTANEIGSLESAFFHHDSNVQRIMINFYPTIEKKYTDLEISCMKQINEVQQEFFNSEFDHVVFISDNSNLILPVNISSMNYSTCGSLLPSRNCSFIK